jgi:hypothetical protein
VTDAELLAEMRKQYAYATLADHMLVDGVLHLRCRICDVNPVPHNAGVALWCDQCLAECVDGDEDLNAFVARKRGARGDH